MSALDTQDKRNKLAPAMPEELINAAERLFAVPSTSHNETAMAVFIIREVERMHLTYVIDDYGNIIVTKGEGPWACFCAHLDTVHMYPNGFNVHVADIKEQKYIYATDNKDKTVGVGGDDKCGVFVCLYLLKHAQNVRTIFFVEEETGGLGSGNINTAWFKNCRFLGGVDRWNGEDFIDNYMGRTTISKAFRAALAPLMKEHGYHFNSGLFTDCFNVQSRGVSLSTFNISCGYYAHHTSKEYVDLGELYNCCLFCLQLTLDDTKYPYTIQKKTASAWYGAGSTYGSIWSNNTGYKGPNKVGHYEKGKDGKYERQEDYEWVRDADTGIWKKQPVSLSTTPPSNTRRCKVCEIILLPGEDTYCVNCLKKVIEDLDE